MLSERRQSQKVTSYRIPCDRKCPESTSTWRQRVTARSTHKARHAGWRRKGLDVPLHRATHP